MTLCGGVTGFVVVVVALHITQIENGISIRDQQQCTPACIIYKLKHQTPNEYLFSSV